MTCGFGVRQTPFIFGFITVLRENREEAKSRVVELGIEFRLQFLKRLE